MTHIILTTLRGSDQLNSLALLMMSNIKSLSRGNANLSLLLVKYLLIHLTWLLLTWLLLTFLILLMIHLITLMRLLN